MKNGQMVMHADVSSSQQAEIKTIDCQSVETSAHKKMQVLVVNGYVRENAGDAALLSVLLDQVAEAFPGCEIFVAGMDDPQQFTDFEGNAYLGSLRRWVYDEKIFRLHQMTRCLIAIVVGLSWFYGPKKMWRLLERCLPSEPRGELRALRTVDLVVGLGGGYMQGPASLGGDLHIFLALLPLMLAKRLQKPIVLAPQSYGPFGTEWQKKAVARVFNSIDAVFVREDTSMDQLVSLGVKPRRLERAVDSGFAFAGGPARDWRSKLAIDDGTPLVGMTARRWLAPAAQAQYEKALSLTADYIQAHCGSQVILIPQVSAKIQQDDDRIVQSRIAAGCAVEHKPINLTDLSGHNELKSLYGSLDYHIGTRFHSVIFALTSFVPCIAIEYEHKTGGIMRELGLQRWVIPIEEVTAERLQSLFDELQREADSYRAYLQKVIPPYVSQSREFVTTLRQVGSRCAW